MIWCDSVVECGVCSRAGGRDKSLSVCVFRGVSYGEPASEREKKARWHRSVQRAHIQSRGSVREMIRADAGVLTA